MQTTSLRYLAWGPIKSLVISGSKEAWFVVITSHLYGYVLGCYWLNISYQMNEVFCFARLEFSLNRSVGYFYTSLNLLPF